jgi:hypothetical protein
MVTLIVLTHFTFVSPLCLEHSKKLSNIKQVISNNLLPATSRGFNIEKIYSNHSFYYLLQLNQSQQTYQPNAHPTTNTQSPNTTSIYTKHPNNTHHRLHQNSSYNNTFQQHIQHPHSIMQPNSHAAISTDFSIKNSSPSVCSFSIKNSSSCSYDFSISPTKIPTLGMQLFYQKQLMQPNMQLFPTTFLSKTAQQKSPPSVCSFSIKNSSCSPTCSYFQRLFYQKQPNKNPHPRYAAFLSKTAHAAQHAAISNDFSIKNSLNAAISNDFSIKIPSPMQLFPTTFLSKTAHAAQQRLFYQKQLMQPNMQLFPTTFLSKTAHAAQHAAISNDFSIKNSSCSPTCSYFQRLFYQKQLMQPTKEKKWKKNHHQHHLYLTTTYLPTYQPQPQPTTTTTTYLPPYLPPPTLHHAPAHATSCSFARNYSSHSNQALLIVLPGCF